MKIARDCCITLLILFSATLAYGHDAEPSAPQKAEPQITDTTAAFWTFWDSASGKTDPEQAQLFFKLVVNKHPELYAPGIVNQVGFSGKQDDEVATKAVINYLHGVTPYIPRMRVISATIANDFQSYARDFMATFPRYAPTTEIYFTVSLFGFDGGTRRINNKTALLFGIDGIARFHQPDESLKVFFDHELFHQYHDQIAPELTDDDAPIWMQLWEEGLATYVSQRMNEGSSEAQVLMSATLGSATQSILARVAHEILVNAESKDQREYAAFFFISNGRTDLPPRCGYYVGYKVAQQIGAGLTLQQLSELRGAALKGQVLAVLKQMADHP